MREVRSKNGCVEAARLCPTALACQKRGFRAELVSAWPPRPPLQSTLEARDMTATVASTCPKAAPLVWRRSPSGSGAVLVSVPKRRRPRGPRRAAGRSCKTRREQEHAT